MHQLYVLFEDASGYALFRTNEFEEIAVFLPQVQRSILDVSKFRSIVYLVAFYSFKNIEEALANMLCVTEGKLHMDLQLFLENNVPKSKKSKQSVVLGIQESNLAKSINQTLGITCSTSGAVAEIIRGIRFHFQKLVKGYKTADIILKSQLGLGHHYSRAKLNFNIHKFDTMIIQSMSMLDQLDKDINTLTLRVREWYSFHFPELIKIVPSTDLYIKCVKEIKDRTNMSSEIETTLKNILQDSEKVQRILDASHSSMGMEIASEDIENIDKFIDQILSLMKRRDETTEYLKLKMKKIAPNLASLMGELVGARLITQAGSLTNLSKFPASTIQILGAEKSLFRALKTKNKESVKFDSLNQTTFIGKAGRTTKGRMSRVLANKCSLASRIDCFSVKPTNTHGVNLKQQVIDRQTFYETGKFSAEENPNTDEEKMEILLAKKAYLKKRKKERKLKRLQFSKNLSTTKHEEETTNDLPEVTEESLSDDVQTVEEPSRKKRKSKMLSEMGETNESQDLKENEVQVQPKVKRKKKAIKR